VAGQLQVVLWVAEQYLPMISLIQLDPLQGPHFGFRNPGDQDRNDQKRENAREQYRRWSFHAVPIPW
jgi:hypothetical protein